MRRRTILALLWTASALWFAALVGFVELRLAPEGATPLPDTSLRGHGAEALSAWMGGMSEEGRALVLGPYRLMDTVLPLLLALTLLVTGGRRHWWLGVLGLAYAAFDLAENATIAAMLHAAPTSPDPGQVALASALTIAKWALVLPAILLGLWLFLTQMRARS